MSEIAKSPGCSSQGCYLGEDTFLGNLGPGRGDLDVLAFIVEAEHSPHGGDWTLLHLPVAGETVLVLKCRSPHFPGVS